MTREDKLVADVHRMALKMVAEVRKLTDDATTNELLRARRELKAAKEQRDDWKERATRYRKQLLQAMKDNE